MDQKLTLKEFTIDDFNLIEPEIRDSKALMQWAGPKYEYPVSWEQMNRKMKEKDEEDRKKNWLFTAIDESSQTAIGHGQLTIIDKHEMVANIGSVLIFSRYRGHKYGEALMRSLVDYGFETMGMKELRLGVFDFNTPAIKCYRQVGFTESSFEQHAREIEGEKWNLIRMSLSKLEYEQNKRRRPSMA